MRAWVPSLALIGCGDELPYREWLQQGKALSILQVTNTEPRLPQRYVSSESFLPHAASGRCPHFLGYNCTSPISASVSAWLLFTVSACVISASLRRILASGVRPWKIFISRISPIEILNDIDKDSSQGKSNPEIPGAQGWGCCLASVDI